MRRKIVMVVAALLCGALGTALLVRFVQGAESRALEGEQLVDVFVVTEYVPAGTTGQAMLDNDWIQVTQVSVKVRPAGSVVDASQFVDQVAETDLFAGEQLVANRFIDPSSFDSRPSTVQAPEGYIELTVPMSPARVMGGFISPGDTVAIFASFAPFSVQGSEVEIDGVEVELPEELSSEISVQTPDTTHVLMHKVLVTEVQAQNIPAEPEPGEPGEPRRPQARQAPSGNLMVTLALTTPEAERLVFAIEYGSLYMAQEPDDAPEEGTRIQTRATVYESTLPRGIR